MAVFEITAPDGQTYEVEAPDHATEQQVMAYFRQEWQKRQPEPVDPTEGMSTFDKVAAGAGKAVYDLGRGLGQMAGLVSEDDIRQARELDAPLMDTGAGVAGHVLGDVAMMALPGGALKAAGQIRNSERMVRAGAELASPTTFKGAAAMGAAISGAQPVVGDESRGTNALQGAVAGAAGKLAGDVLGAVVRPSMPPTAREAATARFLQQQGVDIRTPQMSNKAIQYLDDTMDYLPMTAGRNEAMKKAQQAQFNRAVMRTVGVEADEISEPALEEARRRLSHQYDNFINGRHGGNKVARQGQELARVVRVDRPFLADISRLRARYDNLMPSLKNTTVGRVLDDLDELIEPFVKGQKPAFTNEQYQSQISALSNLSRKLFQKEGDADAAKVMEELREAFDNLLQRNMGETEAMAFKRLRKQYANFKTIEAAVNRRAAGRAEGAVSPTDLYHTIKSRSKTAAYRGTGELARLARAGEKFIRPLPNSGTAQRNLWAQALGNPLAVGTGAFSLATGDPTYLAMGLGGLAMAPALQRAINAPAARNYLTGQMIPDNALTEALGHQGRAMLTFGAPGLLAAQ